MAFNILAARSRFMDKVEPEPMSGCWLWTASIFRQNGYGAFGLWAPEDSRHRMWLAHRAAWRLFCGVIPAEAQVLHRCDNKPCVNPEHLFLGNDQANRSDMAMKSRGTRSKRGLPYGVSIFNGSRCKRFFAMVKVAGKHNYLGAFETAEEAGEVAMQFKIQLHSSARP